MISGWRKFFPAQWSPECWSLRYGLDRFKASLYSLTHPRHPWLTSESNRILDSRLSSDDTVVEFGCGRSTLYFARRFRHVHTVESDPVWQKRLQRKLTHSGLVESVMFYAETPDVYSALPGEMDGVLVDGGDRLSHAQWAVHAVSPGGWLAVDNINRFVPNQSRGPGSIRTWDESPSPEWRGWWDTVAKWEQTWTTNGVTDTWLGTKPPSRNIS